MPEEFLIKILTVAACVSCGGPVRCVSQSVFGVVQILVLVLWCDPWRQRTRAVSGVYLSPRCGVVAVATRR